jgi:hypothetical protein
MFPCPYRSELTDNLKKKWDKKTREFIDYWFLPDTQIELLALREQIGQIDNPDQPDMLNTMIEDHRLRDISDLPFDLAI